MKLNEKILTLRKKQGLSQEELAEKLNVSRQAVSRWEVGSAQPDATNVLQLSKLFGVTADYLLNGKPLTKADEKVLAETVAGQLAGYRGRREESGLTRQELQLLLEAMLQEA